MMRHAIETLMALIVVPGAALVLVPYYLLTQAGQGWPARFGLLEGLAVLGALAGVAMMLWVSYAFISRGRGTPIPVDPPKRFVAEGLFRYVRNPMYVGALLVLLAEALFFRSLWLLAYAGGMWAVFHLALLTWEEPQLERRFGDSYRQYLATTPRWIPRPPRRG